MAARATLAVGAALGLLMLLAHAYRLPLSVPLLGAALGMTWSIAVNDADPRRQRVTTLALWIPAAAALALGTATSSNRVLGDALFVAVLFASVYVRRYGPRGFAAGMVAVLAFFFALFLRVSAGLLPWLLAALAVTALCAYFFRFVLFPDRPERAFLNGVAAFRARQRLIQRVIAQAAASGKWSGTLKRRLNHHLFRLNETALSLDDILRSGDNPAARAAVLEAELATAEIAERAREHPRAEGLDVALLVVDAPEIAAGDWVPRGAFRVGTKPKMRLEPTTRQAIQLTVASILAIVIGEMLSPQRWYWAVLAAFVVFSGTSSSGETLSKAWSRVVGTALGVAGGIVLAYFVRGHNDLAFALLMLCLFAAVYTIRLSYSVMIFFITMLLSLLYVLIGMFTDQLLVLRLIETAIGAALGGIAATLLLRIPTRDVLFSVTAEALTRLRDAVDASVQRLSGDAASDPLTAARNYDEAFQSVRTQLRPLIAANRIGGNETLRTRLLIMAAFGYYARALASLAYEKPEAYAAEALQRERAVINGKIDALVAAAQSDGAIADETERTPPRDGAALTYLYRIDRALHRLAATL
jgi:hypothetical protein